MSDEQTRLDLAVMAKLAVSRNIACDIVEKGHITVDGKVVTKVGAKVAGSAVIAVDGDPLTFVSRGGFKLQGAINAFGLDLEGLVCLDIGASTGGFTDCMLKNGAGIVCAVDIGSNQLKDGLRGNPAVISLENTDVRSLKRDAVIDMIRARRENSPNINSSNIDSEIAITFAAVDVSFISLQKVLPALYALMGENAFAVALVKPQFEVGPGIVNKKGIVMSERLRLKALDAVINSSRDVGFFCKSHIESPIKGGGGNVEYLLHLIKVKNRAVSV